jgi:hypothetical protein
MSFITPTTVQAIAHSLDIPHLSDEAAKALGPDVEYRLREVIQVRSLAQALQHPSRPLYAAVVPTGNLLKLRRSGLTLATGSAGPALHRSPRRRSCCTPAPALLHPKPTPQEALKFAKHAKRVQLTTEDVNNALRSRNVDVSTIAVPFSAQLAALLATRPP